MSVKRAAVYACERIEKQRQDLPKPLELEKKV